MYVCVYIYIDTIHFNAHLKHKIVNQLYTNKNYLKNKLYLKSFSFLPNTPQVFCLTLETFGVGMLGAFGVGEQE